MTFLRPCTKEAKKALKEPIEMMKVEYTTRVDIIRKLNELVSRINFILGKMK